MASRYSSAPYIVDMKLSPTPIRDAAVDKQTCTNFDNNGRVLGFVWDPSEHEPDNTNAILI